MDSSDEYALITGASRGIGAAIAGRFSTEFPELSLILVARDKARLTRTAEACAKAGARATTLTCDLTDEKAVESMCRGLLEERGAPLVLVNNAGSFEPGGIGDTSPAVFRSQIDNNLLSAFMVSAGLVPSMIDNRRGHVFFMASVASVKGYPGGLAYCAAKHGLLGLARSIREETRPSGVRVTTILPGATLTDTWAGTDQPEERFMKADDIAAAVVSAWAMSERTVVEEILLRPQLGDL